MYDDNWILFYDDIYGVSINVVESNLFSANKIPSFIISVFVRYIHQISYTSYTFQ